MLKNKLYDSVKTYLDKYLFGFDKSQLDMSLLKGIVYLFLLQLKHSLFFLDFIFKLSNKGL